MSQEIRIIEEDYSSPTETILRKYSFSLITVAAIIFAYALFRIGYCSFTSEGVYADFCKLSGVAYFNFYAFPMLILGVIGLALPRLTESEKTKMFFLFVLTLSTMRFFYSLVTSLLA